MPTKVRILLNSNNRDLYTVFQNLLQEEQISIEYIEWGQLHSIMRSHNGNVPLDTIILICIGATTKPELSRKVRDTKLRSRTILMIHPGNRWCIKEGFLQELYEEAIRLGYNAAIGHDRQTVASDAVCLVQQLVGLQ